MKTCLICKIEKSFDNFYYLVRTDRHSPYCTSCTSIKSKEYKQNKIDAEIKPRKFCVKVIKPDYRNCKITFDDATYLYTSSIDEEGLRKLIREGFKFILKDGFHKWI